MDALHAVAPEHRRPEVAAKIPARLREVVILEATAGLVDADPVALLRQSQRGHGPTEPGADDHDVFIEPRHRTPSDRIVASGTIIVSAAGSTATVHTFSPTRSPSA